jgi:hypothetical protein
VAGELEQQAVVLSALKLLASAVGCGLFTNIELFVRFIGCWRTDASQYGPVSGTKEWQVGWSGTACCNGMNLLTSVVGCRLSAINHLLLRLFVVCLFWLLPNRCTAVRARIRHQGVAGGLGSCCRQGQMQCPGDCLLGRLCWPMTAALSLALSCSVLL